MGQGCEKNRIKTLSGEYIQMLQDTLICYDPNVKAPIVPYDICVVIPENKASYSIE